VRGVEPRSRERSARHAIFSEKSTSGLLEKIANGRVEIAHRRPRDVPDGRDPGDRAKIAPSRDHGHLIDGSLSLECCPVGGWATTAALGHGRTHIAFANEGCRVILFWSCQRDVPMPCNLTAALMPTAGEHFEKPHLFLLNDRSRERVRERKAGA
jgi:hypothetical protein